MAEALLSGPDATSIAPRTTSEEHEAVHRILTSSHFAKAPLLSAFLMHVSQRALDDGMVRISEYEIGRSVFQRDADFDPRQDNIVRTYARHLRKRLQEYYEEAGTNDAVRVEIPKGTYVPVFRKGESQLTAAAAIVTPPTNENVASKKFRAWTSWRRHAWPLFAAVLVLAAAYSTVLFRVARWTTHLPAATEHSSLLHPLWTQLFRPDRDTIVVPGDIGFVILQQANRRTFS
jgi:hypothetical protein